MGLASLPFMPAFDIAPAEVDRVTLRQGEL
jgi:hypothetical protein